MKVGGVIIAGGKSSRMGQEKALVGLAGKPVIQWIIDRIEPEAGPLSINANGDAKRLSVFGRPVIPDVVDVGTPLSGLHAALRWGKALGLDAMITVPSDTPFLPRDLWARLVGPVASVAASGGHTHYLTGFWPIEVLRLLEAMLLQDRHSRESGNPTHTVSGSWASAFAGQMQYNAAVRVQDFVSSCGARIVEWPVLPFDPFFNINTPEDLAEAERIAAEFAP